ncbi:hypothetical protein HWV62_39932, partial [Athelia sp. TMB]
MTTHLDSLDNTLFALRGCSLTPTTLITGLLDSDAHKDYVRELFTEHADTLLNALSTYARDATLAWAQKTMERTYAREILSLSAKDASLQFRASKASAAQVAGFTLEDIGSQMHRLAPALWDLLEGLLCADTKAAARRVEGGKAASKRVRRFLRGPKAIELEGDELMAAAAAEAMEGEEGTESEAEYWKETVLLMEAPSSEELIAQRNKKLLTT